MPRRGREVRSPRKIRRADPDPESEMEEETEEEVEEEAEEEEEENAEEDESEEGDGSEDDDISLDDPIRSGVRLTDDNHRQLWFQLSKKFQILPTKYACDICTQALGIHKDVWQLIGRIGWTKAMQGRWRTYPVLVKEFLSTLQVKRTKKKGPVSCTFRLGNRNRESTVGELNVIYGVPTGGFYRPHPSFNLEEFWRSIILLDDQMTTYDSSMAKASHIQNPVFRYIHQILASTVFARYENSGVMQAELVVLWSMLNGINVDFGALLLEQFAQQASLATGMICIGGLITPIATYFGILLSTYQPMFGLSSLSLSHLQNVRMIGPHPAPYMLIMRNKSQFPLPNEELTRVTNYQDRQNWLMNSEAHKAAIAGGGSRAVGTIHTRQRTEGQLESSANGSRRQKRTREDTSNERLTAMEGLMMTLSSSMKDMRADMSNQFKAMRADMESRFMGMRTDMSNQFKAMRADMESRFMGMRTDLNSLQSNFKILQGDVSRMRSDLSELTNMMRQWTGAKSSSHYQQPPFNPFYQPYMQPYPYPSYPPHQRPTQPHQLPHQTHQPPPT